MADNKRHDVASYKLPPICGFALRWIADLRARGVPAGAPESGAVPLPAPPEPPSGAEGSLYPQYHAVNDRPVKLVRLADGSVDALVFDWAGGGFTANREYFARLSEVGIGKDVDRLSEPAFQSLVRELRQPIIERLLVHRIEWQATGDSEYPYVAQLGHHSYRIGVNDFPAEPLYTLFVGDDPMVDLEDWPAAWVRP